MEYALSNVALKRLKLARFDDLNDPFELLAVDVASKDLRIGMSAKKQQVNESEGLLCFSKSWKNPLLWSHYGDKHKGIGLGFDIPDEKLMPVSYIQGLHKISVLSEGANQETINKFLKRLRYTKFKDWWYEDEVRQFFQLGGLSSESGLYFVPFGPELELREIIIGPRSEVPIHSIRSMIKDLRPKVFVIKSRIAYTKFGVVENRRYREKRPA